MWKNLKCWRLLIFIYIIILKKGASRAIWLRRYLFFCPKLPVPVPLTLWYDIHWFQQHWHLPLMKIEKKSYGRFLCPWSNFFFFFCFQLYNLTLWYWCNIIMILILSVQKTVHYMYICIHFHAWFMCYLL